MTHTLHMSYLTVFFLAYIKGQRAVRRGDWKLIGDPQVNYTQLFNLRDDPHEMNNLADDPQHAQRVEELMAQLAAEPQPAKVDLSFFAPGRNKAK